MNFINMRWADMPHTQMYATIEETGETILISAQAGLLHYDSIMASGDPIAPYQPPPPGPEVQVMYDHENRLRSIEGLPPLTLVEFVKARGV
jgi:hypothetical protein